MLSMCVLNTPSKLRHQWDAPSKDQTRPLQSSYLQADGACLGLALQRVECAKLRSATKTAHLRIWLGRACVQGRPDTSCAGLHEERDSQAAGTSRLKAGKSQTCFLLQLLWLRFGGKSRELKEEFLTEQGFSCCVVHLYPLQPVKLAAAE